MPTVSIIIPCYNQSQFLPEALASVVAQSFADWDVVIIDDGSTDATSDVAQCLIAEHPHHHIRLIRQANAGLAASRNVGLWAAQGRYTLPLDADDLIAPTMLEEAVAILDAYSAVGFVYSDVRMFGEEARIWSGGAYNRTALRFDNRLMTMALFRTDVARKLGGFRREAFPLGYEDWDFWLSFVEHGWEGRHIPQPLVAYRRSSSGMLSAARRADLELRAQLIAQHEPLYEPALVRWAHWVLSPGMSQNFRTHGPRQWWAAFLCYAVLIGMLHPRLLPKTLARPLFVRLNARRQSWARSLWLWARRQ